MSGAIPRPATLTASLHVESHQVSAHQLPGGSAALVLGDTNASVSLLGDLDTMIDVASTALDQLMALR